MPFLYHDPVRRRCSPCFSSPFRSRPRVTVPESVEWGIVHLDELHGGGGQAWWWIDHDRNRRLGVAEGHFGGMEWQWPLQPGDLARPCAEMLRDRGMSLALGPMPLPGFLTGKDAGIPVDLRGIWDESMEAEGFIPDRKYRTWEIGPPASPPGEDGGTIRAGILGYPALMSEGKEICRIMGEFRISEPEDPRFFPVPDAGLVRAWGIATCRHERVAIRMGNRLVAVAILSHALYGFPRLGGVWRDPSIGHAGVDALLIHELYHRGCPGGRGILSLGIAVPGAYPERLALLGAPGVRHRDRILYSKELA